MVNVSRCESMCESGVDEGLHLQAMKVLSVSVAVSSLLKEAQVPRP